MKLKDCYNFNDFKKLAKKKIPSPIFHYIDGMDELFKKFKTKPKFTFTKDADIERKVLNHKLIY